MAWVDGGAADDPPAWKLDERQATVGWSSTFEAWVAWEFKDRLPQAGGLYQQPLALLVRMAALSAVYHTWQARRAKDADFAKMSPTQRAIMAWMERG